MNSFIFDWISYLVRWAHVIAGIAWIGNSFYFMWLDAHIEAPNPPREGVEGSLWMVHSGGFYQVEKRKIRPGEVPPTLHWFYWEATLTLITGLLLLSLLYYWQASAFLIDASVLALTPLQAISLSIGIFITSWFAYDTFWNSTFAKTKDTLATLLSFLALFGLVFGLCHLFGGRGAFIHVGGILGTIMVINVWVRILPAQRKMIAATQLGNLPNYELGKAAKKRSVQNSYLTLPVLFTMLSNHYPMTFGHPLNWLVLLLLIGLGMSVRHGMILRNRNQPTQKAYALAVCFLAALIGLTAPKRATQDNGAQVPYSAVSMIVAKRCVICHSSHPTDAVWKVPPKGVILESYEGLKAHSAQVRLFAVQTKAMPLANQTGMTDEERVTLGQWIDSGANGP